MKAYEKIIKLRGQKIKLSKEIELLKGKAVRELKDLDYSYDDIIKILGIGKITAIKIIKSKEAKT